MRRLTRRLLSCGEVGGKGESIHSELMIMRDINLNNMIQIILTMVPYSEIDLTSMYTFFLHVPFWKG